MTRMTLSGYFMSKSVCVPAVLDSEGLSFTDCVQSNKPCILSAAKYRPITLVSGNIRYMRIFAGVPAWVRGGKRQWVVEVCRV